MQSQTEAPLEENHALATTMKFGRLASLCARAALPAKGSASDVKTRLTTCVPRRALEREREDMAHGEADTTSLCTERRRLAAPPTLHAKRLRSAAAAHEQRQKAEKSHCTARHRHDGHAGNIESSAGVAHMSEQVCQAK